MNDLSEYNGIEIDKEGVEVMQEIEKVIGIKIPCVKGVSFYKTGFAHIVNRIKTFTKALV